MTKKSISRLLQASLMCCLAVLFTACEEFGMESNPTPSYLSLNTDDVTLKVGDTYVRKAIVACTAVVIYSSSNEAVATVDQAGKVTAVGEGTATITAQATGYDAAGKKIYQPASVSYQVTITPATVPATSLTLNKTMEVLEKNGDALTIKVNFTPTDATDKTVTWESKDPTIATVENGVVTPVGVGITTITAKSGELSATCEVFVGNVVDLSSEPSDYSAADYDILTGTLSSTHHINILGRKVAFDGMAADNIECFYDVTIYLTDGKTNTVTATSADVAGIRVGGAGTTLTINAETAGTGILNVTGGDDGAGIGTGYAFSSAVTGGNIVINGGVINATGGKWNGGAAGIGTGYASNATNTCGDITINGGVINATGSYKGDFGGAGIGTGGANATTGSTSNTCGAITINGGTVTATGAQRAVGIGTGTSYDNGAASNNTCGAITIGTGITSVTAIKGDGAAWCIGAGPGIGSSAMTNCGTITIGGVVKAQSDFTGATYTYEP